MRILLLILALCALLGVLLVPQILVFHGIIPNRPAPWENGQIVVARMRPEGPELGRVANMRWTRPHADCFGYWQYDLVPVDSYDD